MYDAAHAFGCSQAGRAIGRFGRCEVFSFHATKFFNTFEGGAVVTDDDDLATQMRLMQNFGFSGYDNVIYPGTNGKMTEVCAAMGLTGLESLASFTDVNRRNHAAYSAGLRGLPGIALLEYRDETTPNYQYVVAELDPTFPLTRDELIRVLHAENILARRYFWPGCHRMEPYRSLFPHADLMLPATIRVADRVIVLPTGTAVTEADASRVCDVVATAASQASAVRARLAAG
jgi:dTDP-4-amino-4,6-dideoxygalactose transaminase